MWFWFSCSAIGELMLWYACYLNIKKDGHVTVRTFLEYIGFVFGVLIAGPLGFMWMLFVYSSYYGWGDKIVKWMDTKMWEHYDE